MSPFDESTALHRRLGADLFNLVWTLLEQPDRTPADDDRMLHAAHASRYHWGEAGEPVNWARGEWQVSRVYAVLGRPEPARYHAQRCLDICQAHGIGGFDIAFAHEALARAAAVAGDITTSTRHREEAGRLAMLVEDEDDRRIVMDDLATIPIAP